MVTSLPFSGVSDLQLNGSGLGAAEQPLEGGLPEPGPGLGHMEFVPFFKKTAAAFCPGARTGFIQSQSLVTWVLPDPSCIITLPT